MSYNYSSIGNFGTNANNVHANPLTYCAVTTLDSSFTHTLGEQFGPDSGQCQRFMAQYCANNWDGVCEYQSQNINTQRPNTVQSCDRSYNGVCLGPGIGSAFTQGDMLIRNTAAEKYLSKMSGNCQRVYQPFDPTVANSPLISEWEPTGTSCNGRGVCVPVYEVDPQKIDRDPVMNKILAKPMIALDILVNIYNNAHRLKTIHLLRGTKLYGLFMSPWFQSVVGAKKQLASLQL